MIPALANDPSSCQWSQHLPMIPALANDPSNLPMIPALADSYSLSSKNQHKIIIREQLFYCHRCHLLCTIVTINLVSLSHTYTYHIGTYQYSFLFNEKSPMKILCHCLIHMHIISVHIIILFLKLFNQWILCHCLIQRWLFPYSQKSSIYIYL